MNNDKLAFNNADELTRKIDALTRLYNSAKANGDDDLKKVTIEKLKKLIEM